MPFPSPSLIYTTPHITAISLTPHTTYNTHVTHRWKDFNKRAGSNSAAACDVPLLRLSLAGYETNSAHSPPPSPPPPLKTPSQSCASGGVDRSTEFDTAEENDGIESKEVKNEEDENENESVDDATDVELGLEYRSSCSLLPLRCYLDAHFIYFLQDLHKKQQEILSGRKDITKTPSPSSSSPSSTSRSNKKLESKSDKNDVLKEADLGPYFQHVWIAPIMLKIDYEPGMSYTI